MTLEIRSVLRRAGTALRPARGRHARPSPTRAGVRKTVRFAQTALILCVTSLVCVLLGAVLGVQGASLTASPPDRPVVVEQEPDPVPRPAPAKTDRGRPAAPSTVLLRPGDTLFALADRHGTTVRALQRLNGLGTSTLIYAGQTLRLKPSPATPTAGAGSTPPAEPGASKRPSPSKPGKETSGKDSSGKDTSRTRPRSETKGRAAEAVAFATAQIGKPYVWGGTGPKGYDCSGLVMRSWKAAGVSIPRTTWQQIDAGSATSRSQLVPGDLVLSYGGGHVQLYIGDGKVIHAPGSGRTVTIASLPPASHVVAYRHIAA
jgi:peptidoglycan DL-endopeptidase CwlO